MAITKDELLRGRDKSFADEYTEQISDNLDELVKALNVIRTAFNKPMTVTSGWRPPSINAMTPGAAPQSKHQIGLACDFKDTDGSLWTWCLQNLQLLADNNVYLEDARWTRTKDGSGWVHMQLGAPKSRKRIFVPSSSLPIAPNFWSGKYDSKWDK